MLIAPTEKVDIATKIYQGAILTDKVIEKTIDETWEESAHEEGYQITKDLILELIGIDYLKNKNNYEINLLFNNNSHISLRSEAIEVRLEDQNEIK